MNKEDAALAAEIYSMLRLLTAIVFVVVAVIPLLMWWLL